MLDPYASWFRCAPRYRSSGAELCGAMAFRVAAWIHLKSLGTVDLPRVE